MTPPDQAGVNRREFLRVSGAVMAAGAVDHGTPGLHARTGDRVAQATAGGLLAAPPIATVRIGMVGTGLQGAVTSRTS